MLKDNLECIFSNHRFQFNRTTTNLWIYVLENDQAARSGVSFTFAPMQTCTPIHPSLNT